METKPMTKITVQGITFDIQYAIDEIMKDLTMNIEVESVDNSSDKYVNVSCKPFAMKDLGVFQYRVKEVRLQTFNTIVRKNSDNEMTWWATWNLRYEFAEGGSNGIEVISTEYNLLTGNITTRTVK